MPTFKWLFLKNLRSKTLGQIQNLDPHRRSKSKTTPGDPDARVTGFRSRAELPASRYGRYETASQRSKGDALRILERSGVIAQAALTKIYRQQIPGLREAIEDLSKGRQETGSTSWTSSGSFKK